MKILGISCFYHDSAAALIVDGKVICAAEEERFSRIKHDSGFPQKAIEFCLDLAGVTIKEIDYVVFYEKPFTKFERITLTHLSTVPHARSSFVSAYTSWLSDKLWIKDTLRKETKIDPSKILFCDHHTSHAAAAFYTSPFQESALLTIDGVGEWNTTTWGVGNKSELVMHKRLIFPHSLGLFYSTFTQFLGFQINEGEFKVMGLAPYGKPTYINKVRKLISVKTDGSFQLNMRYFDFDTSEVKSFSNEFVKLFGVQPRDGSVSDVVEKEYANIAASAQAVLDECVVRIATHIQKQTNMTNLSYGGGVALNGVSNWKILEGSGFKNLHIHPAAGDSGGAVGSALYVYHHILKNKRISPLKSYYLGRANSESEIKKFIKVNKLKPQKLSDKNLVSIVSKMLSEEKVVGWVRGRFEWGPRALGARSILADPRSQKMKELVNAKIKFREGFRPFAPVCLYEKGSEYFDLGKIGDQQPLEYMIAVVPVKKKYRSKLGAITHVDGTARPQFIRRNLNPLYYEVVKAFGKTTGIPILLNTSFNLKGEPVVNSCEDAWKTYMASGLDALVIENYLFAK